MATAKKVMEYVARKKGYTPLAEYARQIGVNAPSLSKTLQGDLQPIVLKALGITGEKVYTLPKRAKGVSQ